MNSKNSDVAMGSQAVDAIAGTTATGAVNKIGSPSSEDENTVADTNGKNVGILAMEVYTPSTFITQERLEEHSGVAKGKYTIGLGQNAMGICGDSEDVNSLALTVVHSLMEKYNISPMDVGRLEVGTETLVDKSKSTKTILMDLFKPNFDIEGATVLNACYGGTSALLNAFAWVESDGWDGRYAIVVAGDIAAYDKGPARPTCGAGAVAVLVGRDAPLVFDPRARATHAQNVWDFFKPDHNVEYPTVNGKLSAVCYYQALEGCYERYVEKIEKLSKNNEEFNANKPDYFVFHAPYNKLVQKSYARLFLLDARRKYAKIQLETDNDEEKKSSCTVNNLDQLSQWLDIPIEDTYADRALDGVLKKISSTAFKEKLEDSNYTSKQIGNTYTASVFFGIASLIDRVGGRGDLTPGKKLTVFSYGSGAIATMYGLTVREPSSKNSSFAIENIVKALSLTQRLETREEVHPSELDLALDTRARMHKAGAPYSPVYPTVGRLFPGTYYLNGIDSNWNRTYSRVPLDTKMLKEETSLAPPIVLRLTKNEEASTIDSDKSKKTDDKKSEQVSCVITGVAAGLPGNDGPVFHDDNLKKLLKGHQCIKPLSGSMKQALLDKNVVQVKKLSGGKIEKIPINTEDKIIKLAAQVGSFSLSEMFGVSPALEETMDVAAKLAVAAGLQAMKNAGLLKGGSNTSDQWKLEEKYRDTTGIVYASSFPAMDAAVAEVMRFLQSKTVGAADTERLISTLKDRFVKSSPDGKLSDDDEVAFARLSARGLEISDSEEIPYEFARKFMFKVVVLGNSQLAQLSGCRGPNTQTNAACAGTTQAISMAQDMLRSGRAERVVVIAGDNASGETLLPWLGSGFRALGAACSKANVEDAALPFDKRRSGMLLGAGGIGLVLETEQSFNERVIQNPSVRVKARLLATQFSNSAYHGAALDRKHIASELKRFLTDIELQYGINKEEVATHGVYFSHETGTHATSATSCAGTEVSVLRDVFGDDLLKKMLILNTKGFTGHPMGVSFEDVTAVEVLMQQIVPPIVNHKVKDEYIGDLNLSKGGPYACRYALRFAAGFGSQVVFALYATANGE